jgi:hypothetical protein
MLAIYVRAENNGRKILLRTRLPHRFPVHSFRSRFARDARLTRLAVTAALRTAGVVPWLLALGWISMAALQEPRLLRAHGIHLVVEAGWLAAAGLALTVGASLRMPRQLQPYLFSVAILTSLIAIAVDVVVTGTEAARGARTAFPVDVSASRIVLTLAPVAAFASLAAARFDALVWTLAGAAIAWTLASLPRAAEAFSVSDGVASIACLSSAAALAFGHRQKNA